MFNHTKRQLMAATVVFGGLALLLPSFADTITDATPVPAVGAFGGPRVALDAAQLEQFKRGRKIFDRDFRQAGGLGTDFNGDACRSCHLDPTIAGSGGLDVNVTRFGRDFLGTSPYEDLPGGQIASRERRPDTPGREQHDPDADLFEQRQTPPMFGLGLIEAISEATILANEDPLDLNGDGIYGVARLIDINGDLEVGRFGWRSQVPLLLDFVGDAMGNEIGITVPDTGRPFPFVTDTDGVADPELPQSEVDDLLFFMQILAPPPRGGSTAPAVAQGEALFNAIGCANCHIPTLMSTLGPANLYSDLLLHNVQAPGFRGIADLGAPVGYYRTPPLWGIRASAPYLHNGKAETIEDAIHAHFGEATTVVANFDALTAAEQSAVLEFLGDL
ncbi:MAG: di-heme oxidoredictase family protein [Planctomycetota bacterium]